jgi:hypothetical protein
MAGRISHFATGSGRIRGGVTQLFGLSCVDCVAQTLPKGPKAPVSTPLLPQPRREASNGAVEKAEVAT